MNRLGEKKQNLSNAPAEEATALKSRGSLQGWGMFGKLGKGEFVRDSFWQVVEQTQAIFPQYSIKGRFAETHAASDYGYTPENCLSPDRKTLYFFGMPVFNTPLDHKTVPLEGSRVWQVLRMSAVDALVAPGRMSEVLHGKSIELLEPLLQWLAFLFAPERMVVFETDFTRAGRLARKYTVAVRDARLSECYLDADQDMTYDKCWEKSSGTELQKNDYCDDEFAFGPIKRLNEVLRQNGRKDGTLNLASIGLGSERVACFGFFHHSYELTVLMSVKITHKKLLSSESLKIFHLTTRAIRAKIHRISAVEILYADIRHRIRGSVNSIASGVTIVERSEKHKDFETFKKTIDQSLSLLESYRAKPFTVYGESVNANAEHPLALPFLPSLKANVNLGDLLEQVVEDSRRQHAVRIELKNLSNTANSLTVKEPLRAALAELLNNACKYSGDSGLVNVTAKRNGDKALISIENQGFPLTKFEAANVPSYGYRGSRAMASEVPGSGVGLIVARDTLHALGTTFCYQAGIEKEPIHRAQIAIPLVD